MQTDLNINNSKKPKGATLVEYGLLVALIAIVALLAVTGLGVIVDNNFTESSKVFDYN